MKASNHALQMQLERERSLNNRLAERLTQSNAALLDALSLIRAAQTAVAEEQRAAPPPDTTATPSQGPPEAAE